MTSNSSRRPYDLVLYGATGYQGKLIAQYLSSNAPPSLKWAISGRNHLKLQDLSQFLHEEYPDRARPGVVVASLVRSDLDQMVAQTQLVLNTAGPFCRHGTVMVEACIEHSTAYVDCTGEHVWANEIATKFHEKAQARNAVIIPQCAVESSPPDVMCYMLADCISKGRHTPTGPITFSIQHSWPGFSGGMVASVFAGLEDYSLSRMNAASAPLASCVPGAGLHRPYSTSLLPVRRDPVLGSLTFNPSAMADRAVVMRTWSLFQRYGGENEHYGERFSFSGYTRVNSLLQGWLSFLGTSVALLFVVVFPPFRWLLSWLAPARGIGPQVSDNEKHFVEWRAVAKADEENEGNWNRTTGLMRIDIDVFSCSALLVSEAALSLVGQLAAARSEKGVPSLSMRLGGGVLTPASLGWDYVERLKNAGLRTHVELLKNGEISIESEKLD